MTPLGSSYRLGKTQFLYGQSGRSDRVDAVYYGQSTISSADQSASPSMKQVLHYSYDELNRRTMRQLKMQDGTWYNTTYSYRQNDDSVTGSTTTMLETVKNGNENQLEYSYDANGNITYIYEENVGCSKEYIYNEQNWLMQENDYKNNRTYVYLYDSNGNIDNVTEYGSVGTTSGTPISTIYYGYNGLEDDERWDDVLTWYDDTEITYDSFHNPKNWRDGMNLSWQNGSQLYIVSQSSGNSSYYYDASGARYQKISKGVTTTYHLVDGVAYGEKRSNGIELQYLYDENGSVYGIHKNGILYYFLFNGQGDVIGIYDEYKTLQARYEYDAWGKLLSVTNASGATITSSTHIGNVNPFRYRGYYYDVETGFYYLNSRYYDPEVKRFLTADGVIAGANGSTQGYNLFTYCFNNPVNMSDTTGNWPSWNDVGNFFKDVGNAIVDGAKAVGKFFSDNFGAQTTTTVVEYENKTTTDFFLFKVTETDSASYDIEKGSSKTVTAYADTTNKKVGVKVKAGNLSGNVGTGLDGLFSEKVSITIQDTTYSVGYKEKLIFGDYSFSISNGNTTKSYSLELNKINIATVIVAPYLIPLGAGGKLIEVFG